jgi:hypothetical protein
MVRRKNIKEMMSKSLGSSQKKKKPAIFNSNGIEFLAIELIAVRSVIKLDINLITK